MPEPITKDAQNKNSEASPSSTAAAVLEPQKSDSNGTGRQGVLDCSENKTETSGSGETLASDPSLAKPPAPAPSESEPAHPENKTETSVSGGTVAAEFQQAEPPASSETEQAESSAPAPPQLEQASESRQAEPQSAVAAAASDKQSVAVSLDSQSNRRTHAFLQQFGSNKLSDEQRQEFMETMRIHSQCAHPIEVGTDSVFQVRTFSSVLYYYIFVMYLTISLPYQVWNETAIACATRRERCMCFILSLPIQLC